MVDSLNSVSAGVIVVVLVTYWLGVMVGRLTKKPTPTKIGTADELIQSLHDELAIKAGRNDKVDVAGVNRYAVIATKDSVLFVNLDR